ADLPLAMHHIKHGNEEKEKQTKKYEAERDQLLHIISSYSVLAEEQAMQNEVKELLQLHFHISVRSKRCWINKFSKHIVIT
ncbi:hypothetical protein ACT453_39565, partial [Bacillus sp. D-CC]